MEQHTSPTPRAFAALEQLPALRASVELALRRQAARAATCLARFQDRPRLLATLETALRDTRSGLILLEGPPGSGVTSVLSALAARTPRPLWLAAEAPGDLAALYAQIVALHRPALPLLDPTATTDPAALERLLTDAAATHHALTPITLLIDELDSITQPLRPGPTPMPADLPQGVVVLLGTTPGAATPYLPVVRFRLPDDDPELEVALHRALVALGCPPAQIEPISAASNGNFLYLGLAMAQIRAGHYEPAALPAGLDGLLRAWWTTLDATGRRIAALITAAAEPLPLVLATELAGVDVAEIVSGWEQLGLIDLTMQAGVSGDDGTAGTPLMLAAFTHSAFGAMVAQAAPAELAETHQDLATIGLSLIEREAGRGRGGEAPVGPIERYLRRQLARHAALAGDNPGEDILPRIVQREQLLTHERHATLDIALDEARWELRVAAEKDPLRMTRAVALTGVTATRARTLAPEAAAEALEAGLNQGGREAALKRVLETVERLPDGHAKALTLRRLGEICYNNRMRSSAMRLLSRALDLEAAPTSRAWRDTRESLLAALASAAIEQGAVDTALVIAERTEHLERRAQIETLAVRRLLADGDLPRAQKVARGIFHESMGAWARAEVGVELVRAGDARGSMLLDELTLETVAAWAQIELACDDAMTDEARARRRIDALPTEGQRDRGLVRLAKALAAADNDGAALAAAEAISAVDVRVSALIDLRLNLEGLVAMLALERATRDIGAVTGDDRAPLVAALAAALAALGRGQQALELARALPAGEERDRALARVAVGLGQRGEHAEARSLLAAIDDEDERDWAFEELARLLAAEGQWEEATALAGRIAADEPRAKALADLAVERARAGEVIPALAAALALEAPGERARALTLLAPTLVAAGAAGEALAVAKHPDTLAGSEARSRYLAATAIALAEHGRIEAATAVAVEIRRPGDRARVGAALARILTPRNLTLARSLLGGALRSAAVGREEAFRALELAAPALAALGGAALLGDVAAAVDEIDRWLT